MNIEKLSSKYQVRHLEKCDAQTVLDLYESNPLYFEHCPPPPTIQSVEYDMRALPDGKSIADKHFVGFFDGNNLVAVLDLIEKYPDKQTVFIGLWEALFLCHQLFRAVSGEVAERLHYAYPEYDRNITKYTRDMYKKYTGKTGCLDSTYAADIEERREQ